MKPLLVLALAATSILALGQNPAPLGSITGMVFDESGALVPGATVVATGPGGVTATQTNEGGSYTLRVAAGTYSVMAGREGFTPQQTGNFQVQGAAVPLPFTLGPSTFQLQPVLYIQRDPSFNIKGNNMTAQGSLALYRGSVAMRTYGIEVRADELDLDTLTRTASVRGNVTVRVRPAEDFGPTVSGPVR